MKPQVVTSSQTIVCVGPVADQWRSAHLKSCESCYVDFVPLVLRQAINHHKSFGSASVATTTSQMIQRWVFSLQDSAGAPTKHLSCGTSFLHAGFLEIQSFTKLAHHLSDSRTAQWHNEWQAWGEKNRFGDWMRLLYDAMRNLKMGCKKYIYICI